MRPNRLEQIKQKQLEETPELYKQKTVAVLVEKAVAGNLFEQLQAAMVTDIARIKEVKVMEEKQSIKRDLLAGYKEFVDDYVEQGHDYPNDVAVQVMVWLFDVDDIENGLALGLHLVALGNQLMPERFTRDLPTFIADAIYDWSNVQLKNEQTASPYLDKLVATVSAEKWDLHEAVIGKNLAMMAKHCFREGKLAEGVALCERAEEANPQAGVKTIKEKAQKELEKQKES